MKGTAITTEQFLLIVLFICTCLGVLLGLMINTKRWYTLDDEVKILRFRLSELESYGFKEFEGYPRYEDYIKEWTQS